ncbi:DUF2867 domain-containing protein [Maritalea myrionectae]|uniref:DUF2867 domain-containing protein n=1 Tax=Maritalea myrionectae TaxID=454601 RepID=UPI0003F57DFA|nr:DUF2867 domain-containing protein [Maritalea myrionectae]
MRAKADRLPLSAKLHEHIRSGDFVDCFSIELGEKGTKLSIDDLARSLATTPPKWAQFLLYLRNILVKPFGLRTEFDGAQTKMGECQPGELINFFRIYHRDNNEILMGDDDKHLDYRVSVYRSPSRPSKLYAATWVHRHNWLGHTYLFLIKPFHKMIVRSMVTGGMRTLG